LSDWEQKRRGEVQLNESGKKPNPQASPAGHRKGYDGKGWTVEENRFIKEAPRITVHREGAAPHPK